MMSESITHYLRSNHWAQHVFGAIYSHPPRGYFTWALLEDGRRKQEAGSSRLSGRKSGEYENGGEKECEITEIEQGLGN